MKSSIITLLFLLTYLMCNAQSETLEWALKFGGDSEFLAVEEDARQVVTDTDGNVYVTGSYSGTVDFDPGDGVENLNSPNDPVFQRGTFILKLSSDGELIWAKQITGNDLVRGWEIALDDAGNVYIGGTFEGTADFDPGPGVYNLTTDPVYATMLFVVKLTNSGEFIWGRHYASGGTKLFFDMDIDPSGNVLLAGGFSGTTDFDPGPGIVLRTSMGAAIFSFDGFLLKLDSSGDFIWVQVFAGPNESSVRSVTVDDSGNLYCAGTFNGSVDLDPGDGLLEFTADFTDCYMVKLDPSGNLIWGKTITGTGVESASSIKMDGNGDLLLAGHHSGTSDFDPGENEYNLISAGSFDVFVAKFTGNGDLIWAKGMGGTSVEQNAHLAIGSMDEVIVTGIFRGLADFDPGNETFTLQSTSIDQYDGFVSKLDTDGNFLIAYGVTGPRQNLSHGIATDEAGSIYTVGSFEARASFGKQDEPYELISSGISDSYILKMSGCSNPTAFQPGCADCDGVINGLNRPGTIGMENGIPVLTNYACESIPLDIDAPCKYYMSVYDYLEVTGFGLSTIYQLNFDPTPGSELVVMTEVWQLPYRASLAYNAENHLLYAVALNLPGLEVIDLQNASSYQIFEPQTQSVTRKTGATWHNGLLYIAAESPRNIYTYNINTGNGAFFSPGLIDGGDLVVDGSGDLLLLSQGPRQAYAVNQGGINDLVGPLPSFVQGAMTGPDGDVLFLVNGSRFLRSLGPDGEITNKKYSLTSNGLPFIPGEGDLASGCATAANLNVGIARSSSHQNPSAILSSHPNPVRDISVATFTLSADQHATLDVFDLSGRLVQNLYNAQADGDIAYSIPFSTTQLPSGIYIYRLTTQNETIIERFMVSR